MDNKITVVIPTYNRPECIKYFVDNCLKTYNGNIFAFEIHDSSTSDETNNIIERYNNERYSKVSYYKYDSNICGETKTHHAVSNVKTSHIYLMGDGIATNFNELEDFLLKNNFYKYDLFGIMPPKYRFNKQLKNKYDLDTVYDTLPSNQFFINFLYAFTLYGSNIISKKLMDYVNDNGIYDKFNEKAKYEAAQVASWSHQLAILEGINYNNFKYSISFISFFKVNPMKKGGWQHDEKWWKIFGVELQTSIDKIPTYSVIEKNEALNNYGKFVYTPDKIISLKWYKTITPKYMKKYKKYILRCNNHYKFMWFVAYTPRFLVFLYKGIKKVIKYLFKQKVNKGANY